MPELPEVETIKNRLNSCIVGKSISKVLVHKDKSFHGEISELIGVRISGVNRRAKLIYVKLENKLFLLVHLKMTGQLIFIDKSNRIGGGHPTSDWVNSLPSKHTRISFSFSDGSNLFFNDQRIFGWIKVVNQQQLDNEFVKYGPDINEPGLTTKFLHQKFSNRSIPIKQAIMTNQIVAGVGNIYACDALNLAKIYPWRPAKSLSISEVGSLLKATQTVIKKGIKLGGATINNYVNVEGLAGGYQDQVLVYGRENEPCYNCKSKIVKRKLGGRGTYFCESCQK